MCLAMVSDQIFVKEFFGCYKVHILLVYMMCVCVCMYPYVSDQIVVKEFFGCYKVHILLVYMMCVYIYVFLWLTIRYS